MQLGKAKGIQNVVDVEDIAVEATNVEDAAVVVEASTETVSA